MTFRKRPTLLQAAIALIGGGALMALVGASWSGAFGRVTQLSNIELYYVFLIFFAAVVTCTAGLCLLAFIIIRAGWRSLLLMTVRKRPILLQRIVLIAGGVVMAFVGKFLLNLIAFPRPGEMVVNPLLLLSLPIGVALICAGLITCSAGWGLLGFVIRAVGLFAEETPTESPKHAARLNPGIRIRAGVPIE